MSDALEGGCFCGKIRYRLTSRPMFVNCCHCTYCQVQTGSAFAINACIETNRIEKLAGDPEPTPVGSGSGQVHDLYRCPDCKTAVWSDYGQTPELRFVRVGTLDDPSALPPNAHIFTRSKLPWVQLPDDAPSFDVFYDRADLWPAESLQRREAATP